MYQIVGQNKPFFTSPNFFLILATFSLEILSAIDSTLRQKSGAVFALLKMKLRLRLHPKNQRLFFYLTEQTLLDSEIFIILNFCGKETLER